MRYPFGFILPLLCFLLSSGPIFALDHSQVELGDEHPPVVATQPTKPPENAAEKLPIKPFICPSVCPKDVFNQLNLTHEQQEKIKSIRQHSNALMLNKLKELLTLRHQIELLVRNPTIDNAALDKLISQKIAILTTIIKNKALVRHEVYSILTDEQKVKYDQVINRLEEQHFENLSVEQAT